jgi:hypothetical protein
VVDSCSGSAVDPSKKVSLKPRSSSSDFVGGGSQDASGSFGARAFDK